MREALVSLDEGAFADLGIEELVDLCRAAELREFEELVCRGNGAVVRAEVEDRLEEDRLADLDYVGEWERVAESDGRRVYVVAFEAPALSEEVAEPADELLGTCDPEVADRGATVSLVGPQEAIAETVGGYEAEGVSPGHRELGAYEGEQGLLDELTDRQREVLETAFRTGYYEIPREGSTDDVAAELGVDPSTVTEHLQRAERNLLSYHLSG